MDDVCIMNDYDAYVMYVRMMDDYDAKLVEEPTFVSGRCQPPSMGRRCSVDGLAEPMNRIRPTSATDSFVGSRSPYGGLVDVGVSSEH